MVYLFSMSAPVFLGHWLYTFHSRVHPNWIAPALVPMFCLMVFYWEERWRAGGRVIKRWLTGGLVLGLVVLAILHAPTIVEKIIGRPLPPDYDPVRRAFGWSDTAKVVEAARKQLEAEGEPAFIIGNHYGITGLLSFYVPEAKARVRTQPLVYCLSSDKPRNQLYFWPHYRYWDSRKGQNALYVEETSVPVYPMGQWFKSIFTGRPGPEPAPPKRADLPPLLLKEFDSVKDLGVKPVYEHGQVYRWIQMFECRNLR